MRAKTRMGLKLITNFSLNVFPYVVIVVMAVAIDDIINKSETKNIIILSVVMLVIRYLYHLYEITKMIKEYKNNKLKEVV